MDRQHTEALIVTRSIVLQQGLGALLESLTGITKVTALQEVPGSFAWIETHTPAIVLLDCRLTGTNTQSVLARVQELSPNTRRVLLVDDAQEVNWVPSYADAVLIRGIPPQAVATLLTTLLSSKGEDHERVDPIT